MMKWIIPLLVVYLVMSNVTAIGKYESCEDLTLVDCEEPEEGMEELCCACFPEEAETVNAWYCFDEGCDPEPIIA